MEYLNNTSIQVSFLKNILTSFYPEEGLEILKGLYRETIPDFYGYLLFGPSIVFSLFDISEFELKPILPSESNRYYPMIKYRIRLLVRHFLKKDSKLDELLCKKSECSLFLKKKIDIIDEYLRKDDDVTLFTAKRNKELELFEASLDEIITNMRSEMKVKYIKYENTDRLFELLNRHIPIMERMDRKDETGIILTPILNKKTQINQIGIDCRLSNVSNLPIKLFPGVRIGQIIFDRTTSLSKYKGNRKYAYPIGPESSKIISDEDGRFFVNFQHPPLNDSPVSPLAGRS
jgi:hypothetical protein